MALVKFCEGGRVSLIGHSAGGWLARVYMEEFEKSDHIALLLTLGSPHLYDFTMIACMNVYDFFCVR